LLGAEESGSITLLHVGSTIPRKRIDVLLRVFAAVREKSRDIRLVRVGGMFTAAQNQMVRELQLQDSVVQLPFLDRQVLAAVYRRAALVMQTSAAEGFGLPVAEALASGTPVVASDLPVLREVGGSPVRYCGVGNLDEWTDAVLHLLEERRTDPEQWSERRAAGIAQAKTFSWRQYTEKMVAVYDELCQAPAGCAFA
jgi:glycosyltransferase involved in cell wall biosynthesis